MPDAVPLSELVPYLRCPRCKRLVQIWEESVDRWRADNACPHRQCSQTWWAMYLSPGHVRPQIASVFGDELVEHNMQKFSLPDVLPRQMYLQIPLSAKQAHDRRESRKRGETSRPPDV